MTIDKLDVLCACPLFAGMTAASVRKLTLYFEPLEGQAGDTLFLAGEPGASMFVVATGTCVATLTDASGSAREVRLIGPSESFGELSLFLRGPRLVTVNARSDVYVLELTAESFELLRDHDAPLALELVDAVGRRAGAVVAAAGAALRDALVRNVATIAHL